MTFNERIKRAVRCNDAKAAGALADNLRFRAGMTHKEVYRRFQAACPDLTFADFDELMREAEDEESV